MCLPHLSLGLASYNIVSGVSLADGMDSLRLSGNIVCLQVVPELLTPRPVHRASTLLGPLERTVATPS
jgi:hypothetical protein